MLTLDNTLHIKNISPDDMDIHVDLMLQAGQHLRSTAYWKWINKGIWDGDTIIHGIEHNRHMVGSYAVHPITLIYNNLTLSAGFATQALIHTEYRKLKNIYSITNSVIEECKQNGVQVVIGFPNETMWQISERFLEWKVVRLFQSLEINIEDFNVGDIGITNVTSYTRDMTIGFSQSQGISRKKTNKWFTWRFCDHPIIHYKIFCINKENIVSSYVVLKVFRANNTLKGHIMDYQSSSVDDMSSLMLKAKEYFRWMGVQKISFWCMPSNKWYQWFMQWPFKETGFKTNFAIKIIDDKNKSSIGSLPEYNNWDIQMSFSDAF
jgi:hypothetical protein